MRMRKLSGALVASGLSLGLIAGPAGADPRKGELIPLVCNNGQSFDVSVNGNGDFTPGHVVNGNAVLVPTSFGAFTGTVTDSDGNVVKRFTEPGSSKGQSGKNAKNTITCTFTFKGTEDGLTFTGSGSVTGFLTPRR